MPKALFFNIPGHAHVTPSLPLVAELLRRGHQIRYFVTEDYRASVESSGAEFQAYSQIQDDYFTGRGLSGGVMAKVADALITTATEILPELLEIVRAEDPDYIIYDGLCCWGRLVPQILKLPAVTSLAILPQYVPPLRKLPRVMVLGLGPLLSDFGTTLAANRKARALAQQYHLPAVGLPGIMTGLGDVAICYTSSYFQPYADTVDKRIRFVGCTLHETPPDPAFSLEHVQDRPLIYVSLGTVNNTNAAFFKRCIEAFAGGEAYVIMSTGGGIAPDTFGDLPAHIEIRDWVPQTELLKRASLFICHGGLNSIHDSLYLGVPLLLIPQTGEQELNARRVVDLGAGLMLMPGQDTAVALHDNAARILRETRFQTEAKHIGDSFRSAGGMAYAADEIEAMLAGRA